MKPKRKISTMSSLEQRFLAVWQFLAEDWPAPVRQHRVVSEEDTNGRTRYVTEAGRVRMWQFDFAWLDHRIAVEMEGGVHSHPVRCNHCGQQVMTKAKPGLTKKGLPFKSQKVMATYGAHTRGPGFIDNCRKYNTAALLGWIVLRYTIDDLVERPVQMVEEIQSLLSIEETP